MVHLTIPNIIPHISFPRKAIEVEIEQLLRPLIDGVVFGAEIMIMGRFSRRISPCFEPDALVRVTVDFPSSTDACMMSGVKKKDPEG